MPENIENLLQEWKQQFIDCFSLSTETRAHLEHAYRDLKIRLGITPPAEASNSPPDQPHLTE